MYRVIVSNRAIKELENIPDKIFLKFDAIIQSLKENPRPVGSIKLTEKEEYRIRVCDYRLIYTIEDDIMEIHIFKVAHRKEVYKKKK